MTKSAEGVYATLLPIQPPMPFRNIQIVSSKGREYVFTYKCNLEIKNKSLEYLKLKISQLQLPIEKF